MSSVGLSDTTLGRVIFNQALPEGFPFVDSVVIKSGRPQADRDHHRALPPVRGGRDPRRDQGARVHYATKAGLTIALDDVRAPADKAQILEEYEDRRTRCRACSRREW